MLYEVITDPYSFPFSTKLDGETIARFQVRFRANEKDLEGSRMPPLARATKGRAMAKTQDITLRQYAPWIFAPYGTRSALTRL